VTVHIAKANINIYVLEVDWAAQDSCAVPSPSGKNMHGMKRDRQGSE